MASALSVGTFGWSEATALSVGTYGWLESVQEPALDLLGPSEICLGGSYVPTIGLSATTLEDRYQAEYVAAIRALVSLLSIEAWVSFVSDIEVYASVTEINVSVQAPTQYDLMVNLMSAIDVKASQTEDSAGLSMGDALSLSAGIPEDDELASRESCEHGN